MAKLLPHSSAASALSGLYGSTSKLYNGHRHIFQLGKIMLLLCLFVPVSAYAQVGETDAIDILFPKKRPGKAGKDTVLQPGKAEVIVIPIIGYNPANGGVFGTATTAAGIFGPRKTTHVSSAVFTTFYTTKNQFIMLLKSNVFTKNDNWNLQGDWRMFFSSQPTHGLSTASPEDLDENMKFNLMRFYETVYRHLGHRFFVGAGLHLDWHFNVRDNYEDDFPSDTLTPYYTYNERYGFNHESSTSSGYSIDALFDNRDNGINTRQGVFAQVSYRIFPTWMGSSANWQQLWTDIRIYRPLDKRRRHILGLWLWQNSVMKGKAPYLDLPALGWDVYGRSGRGYIQGRFRGKDLVYGELEYRFPITRNGLLGGVGFVNTTSVSDFDQTQLFEDMRLGAGVGLRIKVEKKSMTNLIVDFGVGARGSNGLYVNVQETF